MKFRSSHILIVASISVAVVSSSVAQTSINPWQTLEGTVTLKGMGKDPFNTVNPVYFSDVKVSAKLGSQGDGPEVTEPTAGGPEVPVFGVAAKVGKITNKSIIEAITPPIDPTGKKIRWARVGGLAKLQIYDKNGPVTEIPADILTANLSWAENYAGVYDGGADLVATSTASGTQVIVSSGKLDGLTEVYGEAFGYIPFSGVGKFTATDKKQFGTSAVRIAGIGE
jgi:hypothetical protein